jgi:hypothetical protein
MMVKLADRPWDVRWERRRFVYSSDEGQSLAVQVRGVYPDGWTEPWQWSPIAVPYIDWVRP